MVTGTLMRRNKATNMGFAASVACGALLFGCALQQKGVTITTPAKTTQTVKKNTAPFPAVTKIAVREVKSADGLILGEIVGIPAIDSKFSKLQIGMTLAQVNSLIGTPTDTDSRITGKQYQPFYFGGDTLRTEAFYINEGQLTFSNTRPDLAADMLIRIYVDPNATQSRRISDTEP